MTSPPPISASPPSPRLGDSRSRRPPRCRSRRALRGAPVSATLLLSLALVVLGAGRTQADAPSPHAPVRFTSLAPDGLRSEVNVELTTGDIETYRSYIDINGIHIDTQYVVARGAGAYGRLGGYEEDFHPPFNDRTTGLAGAEAGVFQQLRKSWGAITGRLGVSAPTSGNWDGALSLVRARRPSDMVWLYSVPHLRFAVAPTLVRGAWSARLDAGLDAPLSRAATEAISSYHLDVGLGARAGCASATFEYSMLGLTGDGPRHRLHVVTLGAQYQLQRVIASARLGAPFTTGGPPPPPPGWVDPLRVKLGEVIAFTLGLSVAL